MNYSHDASDDKILLRDIDFSKVEGALDEATMWSILPSGGCGSLHSERTTFELPGSDQHHTVCVDERLAESPTPMVTAKSQHDQIIEAARSRVGRYVVEPFTAGPWHQNITSLFKRAAT